MTNRKFFYPDVPGFGNVAVSRHALARMDEEGISQSQFEQVLFTPQEEIPDGHDIVWRQGNGIRLVIIIRPVPDRGARVVKTVYRIQPQAKARA